MNNAQKLTAVAIATALLVVGAISPANAASSGGTGATVTITGGSLAITVPSMVANLGTNVETVSGEVISGALGQVQVSDARASAAGSSWTASAISTAFTPPAGPTIGAALVSYKAGPIVKVGTSTYTANDPTSLVGVSPVVSATGITGDNSATWNPTISVAVPGATAAGVYSAVITHSVF